MKIQIIQLEAYDDYISTRDKIGWSKTGRILLVLPDRSTALSRELDLILLKRHCDSMGVQMALVTRDKEISSRAQQLGIPHFSSVSDATRKPWRTGVKDSAKESLIQQRPPLSRRENIQALKTLAHPASPTWTNRLEFRLLFFIMGVLAILAIASLLIPSANIILKPVTKSQEVIIQVTANPEQENINISGAIPAQAVSVTVEGRDRIESSGTVEIDDRPASGSVVFSNLTDKPVTIPAGTIVRTSGSLPVRFSTAQEITIESGYGITNSVTVHALSPGISGNLPENSLTVIEGSLGLNLLVDNPSPTTGGSSRVSPAPTSNDQKVLFERLKSALIQSATQEIKEQLNVGDVLLSSEPKSIRVIEQKFDPEDNLPADQLNLTLQLECQFLIAKSEDLLQLSALSLDVNLPKDYVPLENSISYTMVSQPENSGKGDYQWKIQASRKIQARINSNHAINLVIGLKPEEAVHRLDQSLPLSEKPQIILTPAWWWRLPALPFRVNILLWQS